MRTFLPKVVGITLTIAVCGLAAADPATGADAEKNTADPAALFDAVRQNRRDVVATLLAAGADPNAVNHYGSTLLGAAISLSRSEIVGLLIASDADVHYRDSLMGWSYLHMAAEHADVPTARLLLDAGIPVDTSSDNGWTPLYKAAARGHAELVRFLVERGADVTVGDDDGETPLDCAVTFAGRSRGARREALGDDADFGGTIAFLSAETFFRRLRSLCGARFEGESSFPEDPGDAFRGKTLVAVIDGCDERELRVPFRVGEDTSRTWILTRVDTGLRLKHDHRHPDGTPDEITMYGGTTTRPGTALAQSFPADAHTAELIPDAATNEWFLSLTGDGSALTYYLERHGKPRFRATLHRVLP